MGMYEYCWQLSACMHSLLSAASCYRLLPFSFLFFVVHRGELSAVHPGPSLAEAHSSIIPIPPSFHASLCILYARDTLLTFPVPTHLMPIPYNDPVQPTHITPPL
jgi:hypothetical protein